MFTADDARYTTLPKVERALRLDTDNPDIPTDDNYWRRDTVQGDLATAVVAAEAMIDGVLGDGQTFEAQPLTGTDAVEATARTLWTTSRTLLRTPWYAATPTAIEIGGAAPAFAWRAKPITDGAARNLRAHPAARLAAGWPTDRPITVTAVWGFAATPARIVSAATQLAAYLFTQGDLALNVIVADDGTVTRLPRIPPRIEALVGRWRPKLYRPAA